VAEGVPQPLKFRYHRPQTKAGKIKLIQTLRAKRIAMSRRDPAAFVEYCLPNSKTNREIRNAPFHIGWQRFLSATTWGVIEAAVEHGKTEQVAVGRALWELGKNPNIRSMLIGGSGEMAEETQSAILRHIDRNPRVREVFPHLRRSSRRGDPWNKHDARLECDRLGKEPTLQARGPLAKDILGSRLDLVNVDDLLGFSNTRHKVARDNLELWFDDVVMTRVEDDWEAQGYGRCWFIGNPWDPDDLLHRLKGRPGWRSMTTSAVENPQDPPSQWRPTWPEKFPLARLLHIRNGGMLPHTFARKYLCLVLDAAQRRFKWAWLQHMLKLGIGRQLLDRRPTGRYGEPLRTFTGLDPGAGEKDIDALSCLFTIALDHLERRIVCDVRSGHWTGPELLDEAETVCRALGSSLFVEGNATQRWMAQFGRQRGLAAVAVNTGSDKWSEEYGVESLAVEMRAGLWVAPSGPTGNEPPSEVDAWVKECYDFDPKSHTGDRLMASWIALKGAREWSRPKAQRSNHAMR